MNNNFNGINKEYLSVTFGFPKKEFGFNLSMKLPWILIKIYCELR